MPFISFLDFGVIFPSSAFLDKLIFINNCLINIAFVDMKKIHMLNI